MTVFICEKNVCLTFLWPRDRSANDLHSLVMYYNKHSLWFKLLLWRFLFGFIEERYKKYLRKTNCRRSFAEVSKPVFLSFLTLLLFLFSSFFLSKISIFPLKPLSLFTKPTINTYEKAIRSHASLLLPCNKYACATIFLIARYWRHQF